MLWLPVGDVAGVDFKEFEVVATGQPSPPNSSPWYQLVALNNASKVENFSLEGSPYVLLNCILAHFIEHCSEF